MGGILSSCVLASSSEKDEPAFSGRVRGRSWHKNSDEYGKYVRFHCHGSHACESGSKDSDFFREKEFHHHGFGSCWHCGHRGKYGRNCPSHHHHGFGPHFFEWTEAENKLLFEKYAEYNGAWEAMVPFFKSRFAKQLKWHYNRLTQNAMK
jgi:hypothetical protein